MESSHSKIELLKSVILGRDSAIHIVTLIERKKHPLVSNYVVMFFRFVTSGEMCHRIEFF